MTHRFNSTDRAILATVAYADIFDFPLTANEIVKYCIGKKISLKQSIKSLSHLAGSRLGGEQFITLIRRKKIVPMRRFRGMEARNKWAIVFHIARWLTYIPSIKLVGVTGALAMGNAGREDDIDLFIIVSRNTLWVTRMLTVCIVEIMGKRRHPHQEEVANSICLNMFVSESELSVSKGERDIYTAHEVMQLVPVWDRNHMYRQFIEANRWVRVFVPNWWKEKKQYILKYDSKHSRSIEHFIVIRVFLQVCVFIFRLFEPFTKYIQLVYMKKRRTREIIGDSVVRFHPRDTGSFVREQLLKRLHALNIPLDNVFVMSIK